MTNTMTNGEHEFHLDMQERHKISTIIRPKCEHYAIQLSDDRNNMSIDTRFMSEFIICDLEKIGWELTGISSSQHYGKLYTFKRSDEK